MTARPTAVELLDRPGAVLSRSHLRELGWGRSAIDAIFRACDTIVPPGTEKPHIRVEDYLRVFEDSTYGEDRVRLTSRSAAYNASGASDEAPGRGR
jgi:hypothetical protein